MDKRELLKNLFNEYCLSFPGVQVVWGNGDVNASVCFVGEAPGKDEIIRGLPFVGAAGRQFEEFLCLLGLSRSEVYITNTIKHRLSKKGRKPGMLCNRPAATEEILAARDILLREISILRPEYIVTLGNVALRAVTGDLRLMIGDFHGKVMPVTFEGLNFKLFPLYHPAGMMYNKNLVDVNVLDIGILKGLISS